MTPDTILAGSGRLINRISDEAFRAAVGGVPQRFAELLAFMTPDHHEIRNYVVRELPRENGRPVGVERMAATLGIPLARTREIVQELEDHLFFLVRNRAGEISWAFPVTAEKTPHLLTFDTGERVHGA